MIAAFMESISSSSFKDSMEQFSMRISFQHFEYDYMVLSTSNTVIATPSISFEIEFCCLYIFFYNEKKKSILH